MPTHKYLKPEDIRRLKNYEFGAKAMVEGYLSGRHRSKQRGSSIEFHEFRQYTPGDPLAQVDWRVFARNDKLFLRTFEQETNLECHLFLDGSASMGFPENSERLTKLEYASFFAACLAWLVVSKNDRVSLTLFDDGIRKFLPPGSTRKHLNELLVTLERPEVPLNTNSSERDVRDPVTIRKISGGTRGEDGRRCRDTFLSLKKTCQKNAISFWAFLGDRLGITVHGIAHLPDLIRQRAAPKPG